MHKRYQILLLCRPNWPIVHRTFFYPQKMRHTCSVVEETHLGLRVFNGHDHDRCFTKEAIAVKFALFTVNSCFSHGVCWALASQSLMRNLCLPQISRAICSQKWICAAQTQICVANFSCDATENPTKSKIWSQRCTCPQRFCSLIAGWHCGELFEPANWQRVPPNFLVTIRSRF